MHVLFIGLLLLIKSYLLLHLINWLDLHGPGPLWFTNWKTNWSIWNTV